MVISNEIFAQLSNSKNEVRECFRKAEMAKRLKNQMVEEHWLKEAEFYQTNYMNALKSI